MAQQWTGLSGSLRQASTNTGLLRAASELAPPDTRVEIAELHDIPFYNQDLGFEQWPGAVKRVMAQIERADGLILACPEYNYSVAPVLKNILDWASRAPDNMYLNQKPVVMMGSGGGMGTSRAQYHLRQVLVCVNALPLTKPEFFANAFTGAFDSLGNLTDPSLREGLAKQLAAFQAWIAQLNK